jgi:hypothetical protein
MTDISFDREVEHNFRWNFSVNLLDISFIMLGLSLVSRETVLPLLVSKLTSSPVVIGLLPVVYSLGIYLPQLIGASVVEGMPRKKLFLALVGSLGERVPYPRVLCRRGPPDLHWPDQHTALAGDDARAAAGRLAGGAARLPADVRARGAAGLPGRRSAGRLGA